jgi:hypothetical protein
MHLQNVTTYVLLKKIYLLYAIFTEKKHSRRRGSNKVGDIDVNDAESYSRLRNRRKDIQIQYV